MVFMRLAKIASAQVGFSMFALLLPLAVRLLPEIIMVNSIVGFDTISYYVPTVLRWVNGGVGFYEAMACSPLLYAMLASSTPVGIPLTFSLKVLPSVLLGSLGLTVYVFALKTLNWSCRKSLAVSLLSTLYFVSLRVSWDMLRSLLGLVLLFVFLTLFHNTWKVRTWKNLGLLSFVMVLIVLSHQLVATIMLAIVFVVFLQKLLRHELAKARNLALSAVPALVLFGLVVYANYMFSSNLSAVNGLPSSEAGGWFSLFGFSSRFEMTADTLAFIAYCYLALLPLAVFGLHKLRALELKVWLAFCLGAALFSVAIPFVFVLSYRWILLLVFPLAFFTVESLSSFNHKPLKVAYSSILILLSLSFTILPAECAFLFFRAFPNYIPSSMLQNSVPMQDCEGVATVLSWYSRNLGSGGVLLVHDAFRGWADLYVNNGSRVLCYGYDAPQDAARSLIENGFNRVFLVWWVPGEGWHGIASLPPSFKEVFSSGRMAIYKFDKA